MIKERGIKMSDKKQVLVIQMAMVESIIQEKEQERKVLLQQIRSITEEEWSLDEEGYGDLLIDRANKLMFMLHELKNKKQELVRQYGREDQ